VSTIEKLITISETGHPIYILPVNDNNTVYLDGSLVSGWLVAMSKHCAHHSSNVWVCTWRCQWQHPKQEGRMHTLNGR